MTGTVDKVMITGEFYERGGLKKERQPYWFHRPDYAFMLFAGMWKWQALSGIGLTENFFVLTTANAAVKLVHNPPQSA